MTNSVGGQSRPSEAAPALPPLLHLEKDRVAGACRSRGFWGEPEPEPNFQAGSGSGSRYPVNTGKKIFFVVPTKKLKISVFSVIFALKQFSKKLNNLHLLLIFVSVKKKTKNVQFFGCLGLLSIRISHHC